MTDEAVQYARLGDDFTKHDSVNHSRGEYGNDGRLSALRRAPIFIAISPSSISDIQIA